MGRSGSRRGRARSSAASRDFVLATGRIRNDVWHARHVETIPSSLAFTAGASLRCAGSVRPGPVRMIQRRVEACPAPEPREARY